jgi:hypothetical protein
MATETDALAEEIRKLKGELFALRDEVRVRLHLGAMDAREAFAAVEHDIDRLSSSATQTSQRAWRAVLARLKSIAAAYREPPPPAPPRRE